MAAGRGAGHMTSSVAYSRVVDLSHSLTPGQESRLFKAEMVDADVAVPGVKRLGDQWYIMHRVEFLTHIGTHLETPYHLSKDGKDLAGIPLEQLLGEAVILKIFGVRPRTGVTPEQVQLAAETAGGIRRGDIVFCDLGWSHFYNTNKYIHESPFLETAALEWIADQGISLFGVDTIGVDSIDDIHHSGHRVLLDRGIPFIENLAHLDQLTRSRVWVFALPVAVRQVEAFPIRVVALE